MIDLDALEREPWNFDFLNTLRWFEREYSNKPRIGDSAALDEDFLFLGQDPYVEFPASNVVKFERNEWGGLRLTSRFLGLLGPQGALPLQTTLEAKYFLDSGDPAFPRFLDIFNHRFLQLFYRAWSDSRPAGQHDRPDADRFADYVGTAVGIGTKALQHRDSVADYAKFSLAGLLGSQVRSASRIESMLAHVFGVRATVDQMVGSWLKLATEDQSSVGGLNASLGQDTMIGAAVYSVQDKFRIRLDVATLAKFEEFLPKGKHFDHLVDMIFFYIGDLLEYEVQLLIPALETKPAALGGFGRLGWTTWMGTDEPPASGQVRGECSFHPAERAAHDRRIKDTIATTGSS